MNKDIKQLLLTSVNRTTRTLTATAANRTDHEDYDYSEN